MSNGFRFVAAAALVLAAATGLVALWDRVPNSVSAQVVKKVRATQSYSMDVLLERPGKPEKRHHVDQDGSKYRRTNSYGGTTVVSDGKLMSLDARTKTARFEEYSEEGRPIDELLKAIEGWRDNKAEDLGGKVVDGQNAKGFRTFVDTPGQRKHRIEVWYDPETSYPVRVEENYEKHDVRIVYSSFKWNPKLDDSLFALKMPDGYTVVKEPGVFPIQVGSEADIKDPVIKKLIKLGGKFHWTAHGGHSNRPTAGVEPTLENVRMVIFRNTRLTDADLVHLKTMPNLMRLTFSDTPITDADLVHLKTLSNLEMLSLGDTSITDAGLVHLAPLSRLRYLKLDRTAVTDAGLKHLVALKKLRQLDARGTKMTANGVEALKQAVARKLFVRR